MKNILKAPPAPPPPPPTHTHHPPSASFSLKAKVKGLHRKSVSAQGLIKVFMLLKWNGHLQNHQSQRPSTLNSTDENNYDQLDIIQVNLAAPRDAEPLPESHSLLPRVQEMCSKIRHGGHFQNPSPEDSSVLCTTKEYKNRKGKKICKPLWRYKHFIWPLPFKWCCGIFGSVIVV